jgi:hypothetical protein
MNYRSSFFAIILTILCNYSESPAGELGLNIFGLSYHYQSSSYLEGGVETEYNQLNKGAGLQYILSEKSNHLYFIESGLFEDSKSNRAFYAAIGLKYFLFRPLSVGIALTYLNSPTYGVPVAPLPVITCRIGFAALNAIWVPALDKRESSAIAFYATIHFLESGS